jgi:hypothetical protein
LIAAEGTQIDHKIIGRAGAGKKSVNKIFPGMDSHNRSQWDLNRSGNDMAGSILVNYSWDGTLMRPLSLSGSKSPQPLD